MVTITHSWTKPHSSNQRTVATCDGLLKLLIRLTQDADQTRDPVGINERHLVVTVLVDEVPCGARGVTLHLSVLTGEKLNQSWNTMQRTHLKDKRWPSLTLQDSSESVHTHCDLQTRSLPDFWRRCYGNTGVVCMQLPALAKPCLIQTDI